MREDDANLLRGLIDDVDDEDVVEEEFVCVEANSVDGKGV